MILQNIKKSQEQKRPLKLILFSQKGGAGKSTLSLIMYIFLKDKKFRPILVDLDEQQAALFKIKENIKNDLPVYSNSELTDQLLKESDILIYDTPAYGVTETLAEADIIIVPTGDSHSDFVSFKNTIDFLSAYDKSIFVLQTMSISEKQSLDFREKILHDFPNRNWQLLDTIIKNRAGYREFIANGSNPLSTNSKISEEIGKLFKEIFKY